MILSISPYFTKAFSLFRNFAALFTFATLSPAMGFDLPPDFSTYNGRQWSSHIEAEQTINQDSGMVQLRIAYHIGRGTFRHIDGPLMAWVRLNGVTASFPMTFIDGRDGGRFEVRLSNRPYNCARRSERIGEIGAWACWQPTPEMRELFTWATRTSPDGRMTLNAWDVDVAFVNRRSQWDSRGGDNYHFRFNE